MPGEPADAAGVAGAAEQHAVPAAALDDALLAQGPDAAPVVDVAAPEVPDGMPAVDAPAAAAPDAIQDAAPAADAAVAPGLLDEPPPPVGGTIPADAVHWPDAEDRKSVV